MSRRKALVLDPLEVVNRFIAAANRHDADGVAACVHREFESLQPQFPARNFRGSAQLLANWKAIFRNEPGFRLTMLRSAVDGGTVWVELHGAGQDAEVAGIFIIGVENGLIRWARVYSALVEPAPEPVVELVAAPAEGEGPTDEGPEEDAVQGERQLRLVEDSDEPVDGEVAAAEPAQEDELLDESETEIETETEAETEAETVEDEQLEEDVADQSAPDAEAVPETVGEEEAVEDVAPDAPAESEQDEPGSEAEAQVIADAMGPPAETQAVHPRGRRRRRRRRG